MKLTKKIQNVLDEDKRSFLKDPAFIELRDFYIEMQKKGIATKQEYNLPGLDLVGRSLTEHSD